MNLLRAEYIIIEEASRILQDIRDVLPESRSTALFNLTLNDEIETTEADNDFRKAARTALLKELIEFLDLELNPPPRPRPRLVQPNERASTLQLTYQRLLSVLREWDSYTFLELTKTSRGIPVSTVASQLASGGDVFPGASEAVRIKLSDLAGLLWKSLEAGPEQVDHIHDEFYAEEQAQHFKETYKSPEHIWRTLGDGYARLLPPAEVFVKLGRPAQVIIVREGFLQRAVDNYEQGVKLKEEEERAERLEQKRRSEERRKVDAAVKRMRELDKSQCVFCGKKLASHLKYVRLTAGIYEVLERSYGEPDSSRFDANIVMLACTSCASRIEGKTPENIDTMPIFGRFTRNGG